MDELFHQAIVARDDHDEVVAVILHRLEQRVDGLLTEVVVALAVEGVGLVHEQHAAHGLLDDLLGLQGCLPHIQMRCGKGYTLSPEAEPLVRDYIAEESAAGDSFGNARGVRNIFEHILVAQNNRLAKLETVTRDDLMTLTADDVLRARGKLDE